jgi:magnesium-protoporphyrin O-methyltransferase
VPDELCGLIDFRVGDMSSDDLGHFDHIVAMDSLIHYRLEDVLQVVNMMAARSRSTVSFTFAPSTPLLALMHSVGRLFPRGNRSPSIQPVKERELTGRITGNLFLAGWRVARSQRVSSGFYTSQAVELELR